MHHFGEASKGPRGFVQRVKHSMTFKFKFVFTGDHGASSMTLKMRNVHGEMVQVRGYSSKTLNESIIHSCLFQLQPISPCYAKDIGSTTIASNYGRSKIHLCNREFFLFHIDHRYEAEAHFKESLQVEETIYGFHTCQWACASNFDIDKHWYY